MKPILIFIVFVLLFMTFYVESISISAYRNHIQHLTPNEFKWNLQCGETFHKPKFSKYQQMKRIVGGEEAVRHSWPFLVSIRVEANGVSEHHCGGTIISDKHILSAAHCIFMYLQLAHDLSMNMIEMMTLMKVNVGVHDHIINNENQYGVEAIDFHEGFNFSDYTLTNDLMILTLNRKIKLNDPQVNVACLPSPNGPESTDNKIGKKVVAIGWGSYVDDFKHEFHDYIQQAYFKILDSENPNCNTGKIGEVQWDKENLLCAMGQKRVTCFGDSGGPVLELRNNQQWYLIGVISFGNDIQDDSSYSKKCDSSMPFYFMNVERFYDWIKSRIEN